MESAAVEQQLRDAVRQLRTGNLASEADVKQAVIVPILRALSWNTDDNRQLKTEHPVANGRVDYALFHYGQPKAFIEAKRKGEAENQASREQLFDYTPNRDIPILVLTDGQLWEFYFGMGPGTWEDRRFHRLRLDDHESISNHANFLTRHLGKEAVGSGLAQYSAHEIFDKNQTLKHANQALAACWRELLVERHEDLCGLLRKQVREKCGVEPREDDVNTFLKKVATGANWESHGQKARKEEPLASPQHNALGATTRTSRQGKKTPASDFRQPILELLMTMGGRGKPKKVLEKLEEAMAPQLGVKDKETDNHGRVVWKHAVASLIYRMRQQGLLKPVSEDKLWEISEQGRKYLREQQ